MPTASDEFLVDFPSLDIAPSWIERHCVIPDGFKKGRPFILPDWQLWFFSNFYRVKPTAKVPFDVPAVGAPAFYYRRAQVILPQKIGKGPMTAAHICLEAVGPAMFAGWARAGQQYRCSDHGCPCGWVYTYLDGEAMGHPWPTPLIQVTAYSEEQTDNVYGALRPMIDEGPLSEQIPRTTNDYIVLPRGGRIDTVTSSAQSRLGQRVTFVPQDETQLWTESNKMDKVADTQRRGAAGMQGRTCETTNAFDPSENSVAQKTWEANVPDVFKLFRQAAPKLSFGDKRERRKILEHVYDGTPWIDLDGIEAEIQELFERGERGQAERFFGNRLVAGNGTWLEDGLWSSAEAFFRGTTYEVDEGTEVCGGFDGSDNDDWTAIRLETKSGYRFTPHYKVGDEWRPTYWNPAEWGGSIPRGEVHAAWSQITSMYRVRRVYCDPRDWQSEIGDWALLYGEEVFQEWATYRIEQMFQALQRSRNDYKSGRSTHDDDHVAAIHAANARKIAKPGQKFILGKPTNHQKIDIVMADTLAHEAASELREEGWGDIDSTVTVFQRSAGTLSEVRRGTYGRARVSPELSRRGR